MYWPHFGLNNLFVLCPWQRGKKGILALKQKNIEFNHHYERVYWSIRIIKSDRVLVFLKIGTQVEHSCVQLDISLLRCTHS